MKLLTGILLIIGVAGCSSPKRGEPIAGPLPIQTEKVARGEVVFNQSCTHCHPGGEGGLGPSLNDKPAPAFLMKTQVRLGLGAMPSFSKHEIASEDLDALTAYLLKLRRHEPDKNSD